MTIKEKDFYLIDGDRWLRTNFWISEKIFKNFMSEVSTDSIPIWNRMALELHSDCNRNCKFCPRYKDRSGIRKDKNGKHIKKLMPSSQVFDIVDQAAKIGFKGSVGFHRLSEPFLDKRYLEVARYVKQRGMRLEEDTNGDVLKKDLALCNNLDGLLDSIRIGLYDYKNNKEKKEEMRFWKNRFKKTRVLFSLAAEFPRIRINSDLKHNRNERNNQRSNNYPCSWTNGLRIRYDGEVSLCCEDDECVFGLGNVFNSSLKDIWWSNKHIKIVNSLKKSGARKLYPLCKECTFVGFSRIPSFVNF